MRVERKVVAIPNELSAGPVRLVTAPVRLALHGFAVAWKCQYASVLQDEAKVSDFRHARVIF